MPKSPHPLRSHAAQVPPDTELLSWLALQNHSRIDCTVVARRRHVSVTIGNVNCLSTSLREALAEVKHLIEKRAFGDHT